MLSISKSKMLAIYSLNWKVDMLWTPVLSNGLLSGIWSRSGIRFNVLFVFIYVDFNFHLMNLIWYQWSSNTFKNLTFLIEIYSYCYTENYRSFKNKRISFVKTPIYKIKIAPFYSYYQRYFIIKIEHQIVIFCFLIKAIL